MWPVYFTICLAGMKDLAGVELSNGRIELNSWTKGKTLADSFVLSSLKDLQFTSQLFVFNELKESIFNIIYQDIVLDPSKLW